VCTYIYFCLFVCLFTYATVFVVGLLSWWIVTGEKSNRTVHAYFVQHHKGGFTHSMPCLCRARAVLLPCHALIHTCHVAPLPCSNSAVSFVKVRMVAGKYPNCYSNSLTDRPFCSVLLPLFTVAGMDRWEEDWYASDNNLRGTPRGSRKKPNTGR